MGLQEFGAFFKKKKQTGVPGHPAKSRWKYLRATETK